MRWYNAYIWFPMQAMHMSGAGHNTASQIDSSDATEPNGCWLGEGFYLIFLST